jgi:hypothetical protein
LYCIVLYCHHHHHHHQGFPSLLKTESEWKTHPNKHSRSPKCILQNFKIFNWDPHHPQKLRESANPTLVHKIDHRVFSISKFLHKLPVKSIKQWKTCIHSNPTISLITYIAECLPPGICTKRV